MSQTDVNCRFFYLQIQFLTLILKIMSPKEKAFEMVSKQFEILAKATNYKGLKSENEKKFYAIENAAKQCATIGVDSILNIYKTEWNIENFYWQEVKSEIEKL